jgi:hypothetical protein
MRRSHTLTKYKPTIPIELKDEYRKDEEVRRVGIGLKGVLNEALARHEAKQAKLQVPEHGVILRGLGRWVKPKLVVRDKVDRENSGISFDELTNRLTMVLAIREVNIKVPYIDEKGRSRVRVDEGTECVMTSRQLAIRLGYWLPSSDFISPWLGKGVGK